MEKKVVIPWELKADFRLRGYTGLYKGFLYAIREKYGAAAVFEIYERVVKMDDRMKNLTNTLLTIFKIEGNDAETIANWEDIYLELMGLEYSWLVRSKTISKLKITKCPMKLAHKDLSDLCKIMKGVVVKTINPKLALERPKGICAGDSYCEYVFKIEE